MWVTHGRDMPRLAGESRIYRLADLVQRIRHVSAPELIEHGQIPLFFSYFAIPPLEITKPGSLSQHPKCVGINNRRNPGKNPRLIFSGETQPKILYGWSP